MAFFDEEHLVLSDRLADIGDDIEDLVENLIEDNAADFNRADMLAMLLDWLWAALESGEYGDVSTHIHKAMLEFDALPIKRNFCMMNDEEARDMARYALGETT